MWLDALRGIGILLVLLAHNNPPFIRFIFGFHMPLFYALSGYLFKETTINRKPFEQIKRLLMQYIVPYLILCFANLILHLLHIAAVVPDHKIPFDRIPGYLIGILLTDGDRMPQCSPLWFLVSLAISLFLFYLIRKVSFAGIRAVILIIAAALTFFLFRDGENMLPFALHTVCPALLFLEAGYLLKRANFPERIARIVEFCAMLVFLALGYVLIRFNPVNPWVDISKARFGELQFTIPGAVLLIASCMLACYLLDQIIPVILKPFSLIGRHTIFLLAFDEASNALGGSVLQHFLPAWEWYISFAIRSLILAVLFLLWQLMRSLIPSERIRKLLDY